MHLPCLYFVAILGWRGTIRSQSIILLFPALTASRMVKDRQQHQSDGRGGNTPLLQPGRTLIWHSFEPEMDLASLLPPTDIGCSHLLLVLCTLAFLFSWSPSSGSLSDHCTRTSEWICLHVHNPFSLCFDIGTFEDNVILLNSYSPAQC